MAKLGIIETLVFVVGFSIMLIEIGGARLISPYMGNTIFAWTSIISVVLAALGVGYWVGGVLADKRHDFRFLCWLSLAGGAYTIAIPAFSMLALGPISFIGVEFGPMVASLLLFALPNILLGMVVPFSVKLRTKRMMVGRSVGNLYAIEVAGSITGTLLTGFILIPYVGIAQSFAGIGILLIIMGAVFYRSARYAALALAAIALPLLITLVASLIPNNIASPTAMLTGNVVYRVDSAYYQIEVINQSGLLLLRTDLTPQTVLMPQETNTLFEAYGQYQKLIYYNRPYVQNALYLGLGGGAMVDNLYQNTNADITIVEIDPAVIKVAMQFFNLSKGPRVNVINEDGRFFLRSSTETYNMIVLDVYGSSALIPPEFTTLQAAQEIKSHLSADGSVLINMPPPIYGNNSCAFRSFYKTYASVFQNMYIFPMEPSQLNQEQSVIQNIVVIASDRQYPINSTVNSMLSFANADQIGWVANGNYNKQINTTGCPILTDNNNPYELYSAGVLKMYYCSGARLSNQQCR